MNEIHRIPVIFPDEAVRDILITTSCSSCSPIDALDRVLSKTNLVWKQTGTQFTVFKTGKPHQFSLSGFVTDLETGETIPHANIYIPDVGIGDISSPDGAFSLVNIPTKSCSLSVSYIGYKTTKVELNFPRDEYNLLKVNLQPRVISTAGVWITAENREFMDRSDAPGKISFSPRHITTLPNLGEVDIFRSLQLLPGIQFGLGGTSDLYIRGGTPDQNLILLDGMSIYHRGHLFGFVSGINANTIKDIQVYKGGFPAQFGGRISSVIELTSRNGNSLRPRGSFYGNLMSQGFSIELPIVNRGNWILNMRRSTVSNYQAELYNSIQNFITGDNQFDLIGESADTSKSQTASYSPNFSYIDLNSRFTYLLSPKNKISITISAGKDSIRETRKFYGFESTFGYDTSITKQKTEWMNNGISLNWNTYWNHVLDSKMTISDYTYKSNYESGQTKIVNQEPIRIGSSNEKNNVHDKTFNLHGSYKGFNKHKIASGIESSYYDIQFLDEKKDETSDSTYQFIQSSYLHSFYIQDKYTALHNCIIQSGIRVSYFSELSKFFSAPRFSIMKKFDNEITLEGSLGRHYQFIHQFNSNYSTRGTDGMWLLSSNDIPNISSINYHLGLNWKYNHYSITAELYQRTSENLIEFQSSATPLSNNSKTILTGIGYSKGAEFLIRKKKGNITGWLSYLLNKTVFEFPDLNDGKIFPGDHDKTHEIKCVLITKFGNWDLTVNWVYSSGRVYTQIENIDNSNQIISIIKDRNDIRLNPIHHLDMSISTKRILFTARIHTGISIYNIYNKNNISHKRYNPYTPVLTITDVSMFGITPTLFLNISF
tara:strand:- start:3177 stop:5654 length:2478 start_codon:yes stop_codon:yes gene_type:complete